MNTQTPRNRGHEAFTVNLAGDSANPTTAAAAPQSPGKAITFDAVEIALTLSRIGALVYGADEALNALNAHDEPERILHGHLVDYIGLIRDQIEFARAAAERIEVAGFSVDRANA